MLLIYFLGIKNKIFTFKNSLIQHVKLRLQERFAVQLEFILTCLQHGSLEDAYQAALW